MTPAGFDGLAGAPAGAAQGEVVPEGIRTVRGSRAGATRIVLVRHGEAICNVTGVCGGPVGCTGLTPAGRRQIESLRDRLAASGELAGTAALYASVLPRAVETAELLAPALGPDPSAELTGARHAGPPAVVTDCGICELHPGEADGLTWEEFGDRFGPVDWDDDPSRPLAPGAESWTGFVQRVSAALDGLVSGRAGSLIVAVCHAGVVEASLLAKMPVAGGLSGARLRLNTRHASLTTWDVEDGSWRLAGYNDAGHLASLATVEAAAAQQA